MKASATIITTSQTHNVYSVRDQALFLFATIKHEYISTLIPLIYSDPEQFTLVKFKLII